MSTPTRFAGIIIGAGKFHVVTSTDPKQRPKVIDLQDTDWHGQIAAIVGPGSVVAVELAL